MQWKVVHTLTFVVALLLSYRSAADNEYTFPKLISADKLKYPLSAQARSLEGWAYYSYIVGVDGRVSDVEILDSNGIGVLNDRLISSVESRIYEPATLDGKAVEHAFATAKATFILTDKPRAAGRTFYRRFKQTKSAISKGKFDEAKELLDKLGEIKKRSLYEELYLQSAYVMYFHGIGESERAYTYIVRLLDFHSDKSRKERLVDEDYFVPFLAIAYQYELSKTMIGDALGSASWLSTIAPKHETSIKVIKHAEELAEYVETKQHSTTQTLTTPVYGGNQSIVSLALAKKELELSDVTGVIDTVYLRCKRGIKVLQSSSGIVWIIPPSWGACTLTIYGEVGATFTLTEFPSGTLEAHR